ncbi:MAG TPA: hypothetical protein VFN76_10015 [Candidatus Limnocylindria bacterium]|nr:hypothetical protein [Candidatus Limnocylindria bacterium]
MAADLSVFLELGFVDAGFDQGTASAATSAKQLEDASAAAAKAADELGKVLTDSLSPEEFKRKLAKVDAAIVDAAKNSEKSGSEIAKELLAGFSRQLDLSRSEIREELARGLITPEQARARGVEAAKQFNAGVLRTIEKVGDSGGFAGQKGQDVLVGLTSNLKNLDTTARATAQSGLVRLREPLTSLATQAIGAQGAVGSLTSQLGLLGVGAGITLAVTAGVGLIAAAYNKASEAARKAKEKVDDLVKSLNEAARQRLPIRIRLAFEQADIERELKQIDEKVKEQQARLDKGPSFLGGVVGTALGGTAGAGFFDQIATARNLLKLVDEQTDKQNALKEINAQLGDDAKERAEKEEVALDAQAQALGRLLVAHKATDAEQTTANQLIAFYAKQLESANVSGEKRARIEERLRALTEASTKSLAQEGEAISRVAERAQGLRDIRQTVADIVQSISGEQTPIDAFSAKLREVQDKFHDLVQAAEADANKKGATEAVKAQAAALRKEFLELGPVLLQLQERFTQIQATKVAEQIKDLTAAMTTTAVDDFARSIDKLDKELKDAGATQAQRDAIRALKEEVKAALEQSERLQKQIAAQQELQVKPLTRVSALLRERAAIEIELALMSKDGAEHDEKRRILHTDIARIDAEIAQATEQNNGNLTEANVQATNLAGRMAAVANVAFGITSAVLGADNATAKWLGSIGQVLSGFENVGEAAKKAGGLSNLLSTGGGLLSALPGIGSIVGGGLSIASSLFGRSPEEERARQIQRENTEAIRELTRNIGDLARLTVSGRTFEGAREALASAPTAHLIDDPKGFVTQVQAFGAAMAKAGVSMTDLKKIAADLGITLSDKPTIKELQALKKAIDEFDMQFFAESFAGGLALLDDEFALFDVDDPIAKVTKFVALLNDPTKGAPALFSALDGIDLSSAEGVEQATQVIQDLFDRLKAGTITTEELNGLDPKQFEEALKRIKAGLEDIPTPAEKFASALQILQESFEVNGSSAAEKVKALSELFAKSFEEFAFLGSGDSIPSLDAIQKRFEDFFKTAAADGSIDEGERAILDAFKALIGAIKEQAEDAAAAVQAQLDAENDSRVRELRATGHAEEADALAQQIANEKELAELRAQGLPEAIVQHRAYVQALEAAAAAAEKAAAAERERSSFLQDLEVDLLKASGNDAEAQRVELAAEQKARRARAQELGFDDETLAKLDELFTKQRDNLERELAGQEAPAGSAAVDAARGQAAVDATNRVTEQTETAVLGRLTSIDSRMQLANTTLQGIHDTLLRHFSVPNFAGLVAPAVPVMALAGISGATQITVQQYFTVTAGASALDVAAVQRTAAASKRAVLSIGTEDLRDINRGLGRQMRNQNRVTGSSAVP